MNNLTVVKLHDGREVCFSYGVPIAAFLPAHGYVRTDARYSATTSRHMNRYAGKDARTMPDSQLRLAILPLVETHSL